MWKFFNKTPPPALESEMEIITSALIAQTIQKLDAQFAALATAYDAKTKPIGVEEATRIAAMLLAQATAERQLLAGRVARSVEGGSLFAQYDKPLKEIDQKTEQARIYGERAKRTWADYEYAKGLYEKAEGKTYLREMLPEEATPPPTPYEPWFAVNKGGTS